ncbi:hypothetical protein G6F23_015777 [Rhizopus arrhizus]|nr:hypothetical protein G6F23_015777 [Rhizopus arrhizus]
MAEEAAEELQVLFHRKGGVQVLAQALRHVGDARADRVAVAAAGHVAAQHVDAPFLHGASARHQRQQAGLAHAVGADQAHHATGRDVQRDAVQGHGLAVAQADA